MAIPTYVASAFTTTLTGTNPNATVNVALPTGWAAGDIAIIFCGAGQYGQPAGWHSLTPTSPVAGTTLTAFWKRLVAGEIDPVVVPRIANSDNERMVSCHAFRGCAASGNPIDAINRGTNTPSGTTLTAGGVTTSVNDCLIVVCGANGADNVTGGRASAEANANLSSVTERFDQWTALGSGQGHVVFTGGKATAGATGNSTATMPSDTHAWVTIALRPAGAEDTYAYIGPTWVSTGTPAFANTGSFTPGIPSGHQADDILILQVYRTVAPSTPTGYTLLEGLFGEMTVYWKRATSSSETAPTLDVQVGGNEAGAIMYCFRGCVTTGDPWELKATNQDTDATNPVVTASLTPTLDQTLMFAMFQNGVDNVSAPRCSQFRWDDDESAYVAGNTAGNGVEYMTVVADQWSAQGNGLGFAAMVGEKRKAGAAGTGKLDYLGGGETTESLVLNLKGGIGGTQFSGEFQAAWIA